MPSQYGTADHSASWRNAFQLVIIFAFLCPFGAYASADGKALESAESFLRLIRSGAIGDAAKEFQYPLDYTPEELRADQEEIARSIRSLLRVTGGIEAAPVPEYGAFVMIRLTINAGDRSHPLPTSIPSNSAAFRFATKFAHFPDGVVNLELERVGDMWRVRAFQFALPASDPSSAARMKQILDQM